MHGTVQHLMKNLDQEVVSFFIFFSRFEYSLKRTGYLKKNAAETSANAKNETDAKADWDRFANKLGQTFFDNIRTSKRASTIFGEPPKKQIVKDGRLCWKTIKEPKDTKELFVSIRRIRNNLFHGGKSLSGLVCDSSRNNSLLKEANWILCQALKSCEIVQDAFDEPM